MNQSEIYLPLIEEYCRQNEEAIITSGYPYIPFMPIAFRNYHKSNPKIFYVGIDTYYWIQDVKKLMGCYKNNNLFTILDMNNKEVTPERILQDWYSNKGRFWEFVCKLHLYIRTSKILTNDDLRSLSPQEKEMIHEIGWGNMNSVELVKTLIKEGTWENISSDFYWQLKKSSEEIFDPIIHIIKAYSPDYIILLGWGENEKHVFKGLDYKPKDEFYNHNFRALYTLSNLKTKIIWTSHPSRFSFLRTNQDKMIPCIGDSLKLF